MSESRPGDKRKFHVELIKPSHYDQDGYVLQWWKAWIPSNSMACLYGLSLDLAEKKALGEDVAIVGAEETHPVLGRFDWIARRVGLPYMPLTPTFPLLGLGGLLPLPSRWRIEFGEPVAGLEDLGPSAAKETRRVRRLASRVRKRSQAMIDGAVERRGGAFF